MAFEIDIKKLRELYDIEKERQLAMKELSEQLGFMLPIKPFVILM